MEGTYNNPYAQGQSQSPLSPQTPGGNGYQVNVNRSKTRKWVQAPVQNYDGDDWGADEFDDDEPPPPPPVPRVTTGLRPIGQRLPSESYGPSPRLAAAVASSSRSSSGPPSLHLQTQHPAVPSNTARPEQVHNVSSPVTGRDGSPAPSGAGSSKAPSYHQHPDVRSSTPQSTSSSAARASPSIRPSELYRHVDDERKLGGSPLSIAEAVAPKPGDRSTPPINEPNRQGHGQSDGPAVDKVQKQPTFDSILAKRDSLDVRQQGFNDAPVHNSDVASQEVKDHKEEPVIHSPADIDRKRLSVSPQLPDVARMSVFGADFFSSGNNPNAPPSVQDPAKQEQPSAVRQSNDSPGNLSTLDEDSRDSQDNTSIPEPDNASAHNQSLAPANDPRSVPPLRTPSPNAKGLFSAPLEPPAISASTVYNITPTEPLQPRQPEYSPSDYEPASARTQGTMNTFNTSPVKESDMLSEEIMRSLSPVAPTPNSTLSPRPPPENPQSLSPGGQNDVRNSSYTLSDYDSYWADSTDKPGQESSKEAEAQNKPMTEVAPVPEPQQQSAQQPPSGALTSGETQPAPQPESPNHELRRRFSWEAGFDSPPKIPQIEPPAEASNNEAPVPTSPSPLAASDIHSPKDVASDTVSANRESPRNVEPPKIIIPPSGGISHQVSKASTLPPSQQPATLEPPSPVSVENDDATPQAAEDRRPSLADKTLAQTPSNLTSATPPPGKSTRTAASEIPQTTPWRDIMSLATPIQRTLKFEAGLDTHRTWESGLENWLSNLMTEHPEYANGTSSFSGAVVPSSQKGHASGPSVSHNQQPYYQQYLNASSPATGPAASRSRLGPLSAPSGTSGFGNSSNQIGTKSKELMQSAGKMGKGLFSKGKSKLRGTGDKGEPTSPVQTKPKTERRASWGLDRLTRSRADSYSEKDVVNSRPSTQSYHAPQSSQSSSILPFGPVPSTGDSGKRLASRESYGPQLSQDPSAFASKEHDDRLQWHIPTPVDEATWDPFKDTDLTKAKENASEHSGVLVTNQDQPQPGTGTEASSSKPISGNATPTPANNGIRMVPSEEPAGSSHQPTYVYTAVASQDTPASVQPPPQSPNQPHDPSAIPQRHSSFVGLPLIRRGSTFDVNSKSAEPRTIEPRASEPIDERVSIDADDDDALVRQQGTFTSEVTVGSTLVGTDSLVPGKEFEKDVDEQEQPAAPVDQQVPAQQQQSPQVHQQLPQHPFQMHPVQQGPAPPQNPAFEPQSQPRMPPNMMGGNPVQRLPPSGPWKLEESHLSEPLHRVTPKPQQLPPSGQWKLEESHLAEPLHVVNRRRAGTGGSQQDPFFGYNKETGDVPPSPSSSSTTQQYHQRQKPSEVPPSSANRYPGLFPGQQRPRGNSKGGQPGPGSQFIRRLSQEGAPSRTGTGGNEPIYDDRERAISRTGTGGDESIHDDRGRPRKASALFKDIGHRFRKSSTERRGTPEPQPQPQQPQQQQQPQLVEPAHDAASVSSVTTDGTTDKKKHRASFMMGLRSKGLADQRQKSQERLSMPPPPRPDEARPDSSMENKRGSRFYPALGPVPGQQRPVGPSRASTSNLVNELSQSGSATPPAKKRFSAFNTRAAVSGVFNRPSSGTSSKPGTPTSTRPLSSHLDAQQPVALERPHPGFERSNTAGPTFNQILPTPTGAPAADAPERRKRRGSAAGLISGLLGHVQKNKESQQSQQSAPPQAQQPPMQQPQARYPSGPQLPTPVLPGPQLGSPKLPGASFESPKLQNAQFSSPQTTGPPLASPQPQRPQQFGNQQPPMLRQMTGGALPAEQPPMSSDRPSSGGIRNKQAQAAYRNSRPSPLGFGSTTPAGTPPIGSMNDHSRHGTPQTPFSVGQAFSDNRSGRLRSISPAASAIRTAPTTQTSFNNQSTAPTTQTSFLQSSRHQSSQSLDKLAQSKHEGSQIQRPVTDSPNMSFRHDARPGQASDSGMPLSPVSQMSKTGPPSVSSVATQSPRLNTSFAASGRRQSSQLSQPDTPVISAVSGTPPMQNQAFTNRAGISPQQQSFPPEVQQQPTGPRQTGPQQGGYQIAPSQQFQPNLRTPSGSQPAGPHPQAGMTPGRPPMQMQHSSAGPPVPPKDGTNPLQQPQFANAPVRQGSPGASKWKGLKNRMSGQVAHKSAPSQGKIEGDKDKDKLTASKILGAFKRTSRANRESQVIPDLQAYQQHQMQRQQHPQQQQPQHPGQQQQQQPQQFAGQAPYGQTQSPRPSSQFGGQPFGQLPTPRPSSQFSNQSMGQMQAKRQSSMFGSPNMAPQQFQRVSGSFPQGVPGMPQPGMVQPQPNYAYQSPSQVQGQFPPPHSPQAQFQSSPPQQGQFQSPAQQQGQFSSPVQQKGQFQSPSQQQGQFQSPPLQQSQGQFQSPAQQQGQFSSPVQQKGQFQSPPLPQSPWQHQTQSPGGQYSPAPFQQGYRPGQGQGMVSQSPNTPSHRSPSQSQFPQQSHSPSQHSPLHREESPIHVSTPASIHHPTPVHAPSPRPSLLNLQAMIASEDNEANQEGQRESTQAAPRNDQNNASHRGSPSMQRFASDSPHSGRNSGSPRVGANPSPAQYVSPRVSKHYENGAPKTQAPVVSSPGAAPSSVVGGHAVTSASGKFSSKVEDSQGVSLSPPAVASDNVSPASARHSPSGMSDLASPETKPRAGPSFHAELEDTEDARKRTLRINSQEEKIHYDPNADSDGEPPPQMSATSYPGQEWNPYGMPELGDWNEGIDR